MKRFAAILLALLLTLSTLPAAFAQAPEDVTLKLLVCWQGLSFLKPEDEKMNAVAKVIKEKTGITLECEWVNTAENDVLNMLFAAGTDMPDMIMAPFWGGTDACTQTIKKAANDGLLLPLDDLIAQYGENLKDAYQTGVAQSFRNDINDPAVAGGQTFVLPMHTAASAEDMTHWAYTVYGRKDILEALGVDPASIHTSDDLYQLATKIKEGGFKDTMGNPVIPAGNWQNGWAYECFLNSFRPRTLTGFLTDENGNVVDRTFTKYFEDEVLFMRKMISEGLFDVEAFTQDDNTAKSKYATGRVALTAAHYPHIRTNTEALRNEHPEMEYIPLGPINDGAGNPYMPENVRLSGSTGSAVMMLTKDCKNPEAAVKYLNYINSEEGKLLAYLGIQGNHWDYVDGVPHMTDGYFTSVESTQNYAINEGIGSIFTFGVSRLPNAMFDRAKLKDESEIDQTYETAKAMYPIKLVEGIPLTSYSTQYPGYDELQVNIQSIGFDVTQAFFAGSDEEALQMIKDYRDALTSIGYLDYIAYLNDIYHTVEGLAL
jgi:putative aldouronate transport system substrate-binding protein